MKVRRAVLLLGVGISTLALLPSPAGAANQTVAVGDNFFNPANVTIQPNETVTWNGPGTANPHNVFFVDGQFDEPPTPVITAWTVSRTFTTPGTYRYYCEVHGNPAGFGMAGTVVVNDPSVDVDPPTSTASAPPNSASASFVIPYTASDGTGSGVAEVELWGKGSGDTQFFLEATDTTPDTASFDYTARLGNGNYEFYTRAIDNEGNYEDPPVAADSVTALNIPDPDPPTSSASAPPNSASSSFVIPYTASDGTGSGITAVELWGKGPGDVDFVFEDVDLTPETPSFDYFAIWGDGVYEFYTRAVDFAGNYEDAPASPESATVVNTAPPRPTTTPSPPAPIATAGAPKDRSPPLMALANRKTTLGRSGTIQVRLSCPASESGGCRGKLSLATLGKRKAKLGSASFRISGGKTAGVKVRLTKRNQRLLRKLRKARVRATINVRDAAGNSATRNLTLTVAARR